MKTHGVADRFCPVRSMSKQVLRTSRAQCARFTFCAEYQRLPPPFANQIQAAEEIVARLADPNVVLVTLWGLTQSGKTGTITEVVFQGIQRLPFTVPVSHVYFFTGMNDADLFLQWRRRTPAALAHVYKQSDLRGDKGGALAQELSRKRNVLLIVDECHYGAHADNAVATVFRQAGFKDVPTLVQRNIKILQVSATPDGVLYDSTEWGVHHATVFLSPGGGYTGVSDLLTSGRLRQFTPLLDKKNMDGMMRMITSFRDPRYHVVRLCSKISEYNFIFSRLAKACQKYKVLFREHNYHTCTADINRRYLRRPPRRHTVLVIKETLRAGKTLYKRHLGVLVDRPTARAANDSTLLQGLCGRLTGYDVEPDSVVYTNVDSVVRYLKIRESGPLANGVKWNSNTTSWSRRQKTTLSKKTHLHRSFYTFSPELAMGETKKKK